MNDRLREIALASASPRRLSLLESLGLRVTVIASAYAEQTKNADLAPDQLALRNAVGKADEAEKSGPPVLVAADTLVVIDGGVLGKPLGVEDARRMLRTLSGRTHIVHTGYIVVDRERDRRHASVETTEVHFMALDDDFIDRYIASGEPMDKAGAYGIQGRGALMVDRVVGDFYNVMGLPLSKVAAACRAIGHGIG